MTGWIRRRRKRLVQFFWLRYTPSCLMYVPTWDFQKKTLLMKKGKKGETTDVSNETEQFEEDDGVEREYDKPLLDVSHGTKNSKKEKKKVSWHLGGRFAVSYRLTITFQFSCSSNSSCKWKRVKTCFCAYPCTSLLNIFSRDINTFCLALFLCSTWQGGGKIINKQETAHGEENQLQKEISDVELQFNTLSLEKIDDGDGGGNMDQVEKKKGGKVILQFFFASPINCTLFWLTMPQVKYSIHFIAPNRKRKKKRLVFVPLTYPVILLYFSFILFSMHLVFTER